MVANSSQSALFIWAIGYMKKSSRPDQGPAGMGERDKEKHTLIKKRRKEEGNKQRRGG